MEKELYQNPTEFLYRLKKDEIGIIPIMNYY